MNILKLKIPRKFKKIFIFIFLTVISFTLYFAFLLTRIKATAKIIFTASLNNQPEIVESYWPAFEQSLKKLKLSFFLRFAGQEKKRQQLETLLKIIPELIGLGEKKRITYIILLQNDKELRPTGGFMGSFAQVEFYQGCLKNFTIEDIYVPDGAIKGHIEPPEAIQKAFKHGTWRLPNSNWDPDFPMSAKTISWFLEKGGIEKSDGIIALNFKVLEDIFKEIGGIYLPDYQISVSADNLYRITQYEVEREFFPGSTQKSDFLNQLMKSLIYQKQGLNQDQVKSIAFLLFQHLNQRNIQFYFENQTLQELIIKLDWAGTLDSCLISDQCQDYILIVDANLGANKANHSVSREVKQSIQVKKNTVEEVLQIKYINHAKSKDPQPPEYWGGDYKNYLRIFLPEEVKIQSIKIDAEALSAESISIEKKPKQKLQSIGFFVEVPHLKQKQVEVNYTLPKQKKDKDYQLFIQKQSGISYWHTVEYQDLDDNQQKKQWIEINQLINLRKK